MSYEKYKIPPDFQLAKVHGKSCKLTRTQNGQSSNCKNKCGCCNQYLGQQSFSICQSIATLRRIGQQVPLFFNFNILMIFLIIIVIFTKGGQMVLACSNNCNTYVQYHVSGLWSWNFNIVMGYLHRDNDLYMMIELIVYSITILIIKIYLKRRKYKYRAFNYAVQKRSVQLNNLPKNCTENQIKQLFKDYHVEQVIFTYKIKKYHKCMNKVATLKKNLRYLNSQLTTQRKQIEQIQALQKKLENTQVQLQNIINNIKCKKKRLSVAFVVFQTVGQRRLVLKKYSCGLISKLCKKMFPCCSKSAIQNQHVSIQPAPAPDDIQWQNLQNPYLRTKAVRFSSFIICVTILIFGLVSQVLIFSFQAGKQASSVRQIFSSLVVFLINFFIINFLQYTTNKTQSHITNTNIKLSLIRKITFFMFINVSVSPFLIMLYNRIAKQTQPQQSQLFQSISLTILIISIGNFFKPFLTLFSISRFVKWYQCFREQRKGNKSQLNQLQANQLFQPLQFPIQIFYSLLHASLMMSFFYLGCYQIIAIIELPALLIMYFVGKWMLLKICKQPRGLSLKLNNLAQSLMRFYVPLYWFGGNLIPIVTSTNNMKILDIIQKVIYNNVYQIISVSIVLFMLVSEIFVAIIARKLTPKKQDHLSDYYSIVDQNRTYNEANLFFKIHEQGFERVTLRLKKKINESEQNQQSRESITLSQQ